MGRVGVGILFSFVIFFSCLSLVAGSFCWPGHFHRPLGPCPHLLTTGVDVGQWVSGGGSAGSWTTSERKGPLLCRSQTP